MRHPGTKAVGFRGRAPKSWLAPCVATALLAAACGSGGGTESASADDAGVGESAPAASTTTATFVGTIEGTDAFFAVQNLDGEVLAYFCDGARIWEYFVGVETSGKLSLEEPDGSKLEAVIDGDGITGTVTLSDGTTHEFDGLTATGDAGFYVDAKQSDSSIEVGGWIRLSDGQVRGKTVTIAQGSEETQGTTTGAEAGPIPPEATPEPARVSLLKCGAAMIRLAKARKVAEDSGLSAASVAARDEAGAAVRAACTEGPTS